MNNATDRCFACNRPLGKNPKVADTRDGQTVHVGRDCYAKIEAAGEAGYCYAGWKPGYVRLYPMRCEAA